MDEPRNDPKQENCPLCGKLMNKASIKRHINTVHSKDRREKSIKSTKGNQANTNSKPSNSGERSYAVPKDYDRNSLSVDDLDSFDMMETDADAEFMSELTSSMSSVAISNYGTVNFTVSSGFDSPYPSNINNNNNEPIRNNNNQSHPPAAVKASPTNSASQQSISKQPEKKKREQPELKIQLKLEKKLGYGHQQTPAGEIDILTPTELLEIKNWNDWMKGIGQLFAYGHFFPDRMRWLHLFGQPPSDDKVIVIKTICAAYRIKVTYEK